MDGIVGDLAGLNVILTLLFTIPIWLFAKYLSTFFNRPKS